jgi:ribosome-binding ATPase YchF (GTP1/OBG family)
LIAYRDTLLAGKNARSLQVDAEDKKAIEDLQLLTDKPVIYVANVDEAAVNTGNRHVEALKSFG